MSAFSAGFANKWTFNEVTCCSAIQNHIRQLLCKLPKDSTRNRGNVTSAAKQILLRDSLFWTELNPYVCRFLIKNGNHIDSPILYDSYEVEYLPNEGIVSSARPLFVEFTTDGFGTNTGVAIRYEGMDQKEFTINFQQSEWIQSNVAVTLIYSFTSALRVFKQNCSWS